MKAQNVKDIFDDFLDKEAHNLYFTKYNIVGHSAGGRVALLLASRYDPTRVDTVIALDPVDQNPPCFTCDEDDPHYETLEENITSTIILTQTDGGRGILRQHNAQAIHERNPDNTKLVYHSQAGHMAYMDKGGDFFKVMMNGGIKVGDETAKSQAHDLIRTMIGDMNI